MDVLGKHRGYKKFFVQIILPMYYYVLLYVYYYIVITVPYNHSNLYTNSNKKRTLKKCGGSAIDE